MLQYKKSFKTILEILLMVLAFGIVTNLISEKVQEVLRHKFPDNYLAFLVLITILLFALRLGLDRLFNTDNATGTTRISGREHLLKSLQNRYQSRLREKMDQESELIIQLKLKYTKEGTSDTFVDRYFVKGYREKLTGDFGKLFERYTTVLKRLLIIGDPGAGKTVLLLQFAQQLLKNALADDSYPIPIILNLSSWRNEEQTFRGWLSQNLVYSAGQFGTSREHARELAASNDLLLLLDGLDEISGAHRVSCLQRLAEYRQEVNKQRPPGYPELIICCRREEYAQMGEGVPVQGVVNIEPFTKTDVSDILSVLHRGHARGSNADELSYQIAAHPHLTPLLNTAFHLHLALKLIENKAFDFGKVQNQHDLVTAYLSQQLAHLHTQYPADNSRRWLAWLAARLKDTRKGISFELTDMQPAWTKKAWLYRLAVGLVAGSISGLFTGLAGGVVEEVSYRYVDEAGNGVALPGIIYEYAGGLTLEYFEELLDWLGDGWTASLAEGLLLWSTFGLAAGLITGLLWLLVPGLRNTRIVTEELRVLNIRAFNRKAFLKTFQFWIMISTYFGLVFGLGYFYWIHFRGEGFRQIEEIIGGVMVGLMFGLAIGFVPALLLGFIAGIYTVQRMPTVRTPYQRLYASFPFDFIQWSLVVLLCVFGSDLLYVLTDDEPSFTTSEAVLAGLAGGMLTSLWIALFLSPLAKLLALRLILWLEGSIPLRFVTFLNTVADQTGLMERDGGQWRFRHQLIQDLLSERTGQEKVPPSSRQFSLPQGD